MVAGDALTKRTCDWETHHLTHSMCAYQEQKSTMTLFHVDIAADTATPLFSDNNDGMIASTASSHTPECSYLGYKFESYATVENIAIGAGMNVCSALIHQEFGY